jgi:hypothetical protein
MADSRMSGASGVDALLDYLLHAESATRHDFAWGFVRRSAFGRLLSSERRSVGPGGSAGLDQRLPFGSIRVWRDSQEPAIKLTSSIAVARRLRGSRRAV